MKQINPTEITGNAIDRIGNQWMLVTAGDPTKFNTMTASWGGIGFLWGKPVVYVFVRPERYTFEFMEANDFFTLSFLREAYRSALKICGSTSGRATDKVETAGLTPFFTTLGNPGFEESELTLECRKLYAEFLRPDKFTDPGPVEKWYGAHGGMHKMYIAEIVNAWTKKE